MSVPPPSFPKSNEADWSIPLFQSFRDRAICHHARCLRFASALGCSNPGTHSHTWSCCERYPSAPSHTRLVQIGTRQHL